MLVYALFFIVVAISNDFRPVYSGPVHDFLSYNPVGRFCMRPGRCRIPIRPTGHGFWSGLSVQTTLATIAVNHAVTADRRFGYEHFVTPPIYVG